ncbi:MAG: hypothetical protein EAX90_06055 [Candidatus Heimdallarchaeota archaeon]|nr:hypothetical protein [Candidatus Heimdallarchaeota archaeon]
MSFGSILLGALIGGIVSTGAIIGVTFLGTMVPWWALLLIGAGGCLIGGILAGVVAKGAGSGALAGLLSGLLVFGGVFLFLWLYYKQVLLDFVGSYSDIDALLAAFLGKFGLVSGTDIYLMISEWIKTIAPTAADIQNFANNNFIYFALILGAIFGGLASIVNLFAGLIGGLFTRKKSESYDSYY